jgi:hypothetical protein
MGDLLDAVDELTLPKRVKVMQDEGVVSVTIPPLLTQLDEAIRSSMGGSSAGASMVSAGSVVNDAALFKLIQIGAQVRDWCRMVKVVPDRSDTALSLRRWFVAFPDEVSSFHLRLLRGWASDVRGLLDPQRELELPDACPACDATAWWDQNDPSREGRLHPLVIRYRPDLLVVDGQPEARGADVLCRACTQVWGVRELRYALEQKAV